MRAPDRGRHLRVVGRQRAGLGPAAAHLRNVCVASRRSRRRRRTAPRGTCRAPDPVPQLFARVQTSQVGRPLGSVRSMEPVGQPSEAGGLEGPQVAEEAGHLEARLEQRRHARGIARRRIEGVEGPSGCRWGPRQRGVFDWAAYSKIDSVIDDSVEKSPLAMASENAKFSDPRVSSAVAAPKGRCGGRACPRPGGRSAPSVPRRLRRRDCR